MNDAQELALRRLCDRYNVKFDPTHYITYPEDAFLTPNYVEGWVGGPEYAKTNETPAHWRTTIYVGVDPEGRVHS